MPKLPSPFASGAAVPSRDDPNTTTSSINDTCCSSRKISESSSTMTTSSKSAMTAATTTATKTVGERIAGCIATSLFIVLVGYYMIWKQGNINYFLAVLPVVWVITLVLCVVQDEISMIATKLVFGRTTSSKSSTISVPLQATSVEYNTQVKLIMGIVSYCMATYLLLQIQVLQKVESLVVVGEQDLSDASISSYGSRSMSYIYDSSTANMDSIIMNYSLAYCSPRFLFNTDGNTTYATSSSFVSSINVNDNQDVFHVSNLFYLFGLLASYHFCEGTFQEFFCRIPLSTTSSSLQEVTAAVANNDCYTKIERTLLLPFYLLAMLFCKDHNETNIDPTIFRMILSILYAWMVYKIVQLMVQLHQNRSLNTHTMHTRMSNSPAGKDNYLQKQVAASAESLVSTTANSASINGRDCNTIKILTNSDQQQHQREEYIWRIYGHEYDMNQYVTKHPGGIETIMLAANRDDATALFQMYHPFNINQAKSVLAKYRVFPNTPTTTNRSSTHNDKNRANDEGHTNDQFYNIVCHRDAETLRSNHMDPIVDRGATYQRILFYTFLVGTFVLSTIARCYGSILATIIMAVSGSVMAANFGHDGGHFAVSRIPIINAISVSGISCISNPFLWQHQHTFAHHSFTNHEDHDPDLHHFKGLFKLRKGENYERVHLAQDPKVRTSFWFVVSIYAQVLIWVNLLNASRFVVDRSYHGAVQWSDRRRWLRTFGLFIHWIVYTTFILIVPFYVQPSNIMAWLDIQIYTIICSIFFSAATQVGHIFEQALDHDLKAKLKSQRHVEAQNSWAADMIESTQDIAPHSWFYFCLFGGLGLQIEHHLFPGLNHCHLMQIQPIVEQTCLEYGVTYKKYDDWHRAFIDTVRYLNSLE